MKKLEDSNSSLRSKLLLATNQLAQLSKNSLKKTKGVIYQRDGKYYAKWGVIPAQLIAEFQTQKDDPVQVYRDFRNLVVTNPEKVNHDNVTKFARRYKEALPNTLAGNLFREYYNRRLEELRKGNTNIV